MPIAYKYREGTMKRTLKRELKGTEIVEWQAEGLASQLVLLLRSAGAALGAVHSPEKRGLSFSM
jgi:hypothetical protein